MTARIHDLNSWYEVKRNPISKVGVFQYSGASIGAPDPNRIYNVYRPAEELADPACLESFKLIPLVDDHEMLGDPAKGMTPAEQYGVHGTLGQEVEFDNGILYNNLKVFSESLKSTIEGGKRELSCGYRCEYDFTPGEFNGQKYDAIQRKIRGNHIALVDQGRMGPDVRVLDHKLADHYLTLDAKELIKMSKTPEQIATDALSAVEKLAKTVETVAADVKKLSDAHAADEAAKKKAADEAEAAEKEKLKEGLDEEGNPVELDPEDKGADAKAARDRKAAADKKAKDEEEAKKAEEAKAADKKGKGMDAASVKKTVDAAVEAAVKPLKAALDKYEKDGVKATMDAIAGRDALVARVEPFIGQFDHAKMTTAEVAKYACDKLELKAADGAELAALDGFLHNRQVPAAIGGMDAGVKKSTKLRDQVSK